MKKMKEKCVEILRQMGIYSPYITGFKNADRVCFFENFGGYWIDQEPEVSQKMKELEAKYGFRVYAATHEFTEFGECYSFLVVPKYEEEWEYLVHTSKNIHTAFAYVWNISDDLCSEFGDVTVESFGGGIRRVA